MRADSRHSGTAGTRAKGVDATFMLLERYGCGNHVVSVRRRRSGGHVSPVTAAHQERRNTSSQGRDVCYPAQDQLQLNGTAARLRPDAIRTRHPHPTTAQQATWATHWPVTPRCENSQDRSRGTSDWAGVVATGGAALGCGAETATQRSPSSSAGSRQRECPGSAQTAPRKYRSLGSERGLATPSPDGKGEIALGPSMKIMPVDPYNTLGRSCEPAYQVDRRREAARRRHALAAAGPRPGGHETSCSVTWPGSSPEVQPARSRA